MKTKVISGILAMIMSFSALAAQGGSHGGNGGSFSEVYLLELGLKIERFLKEKESLKLFPEVDLNALSSVVRNTRIEITQEVLKDKNGEERSALNFKSEPRNLIRIHEADFLKISKTAISETTVLLFHEYLNLMGLELMPEKKWDIALPSSVYDISMRLLPFHSEINEINIGRIKKPGCFNYYEKILARNQDRKMGVLALGFIATIASVGISGAVFAHEMFFGGATLFSGGTVTLFSNKQMFKYRVLNSYPAPLKKLMILGEAQEPDSVTFVRTEGKLGILGDSGPDAFSKIHLNITPEAKRVQFEKFADKVRKICKDETLSIDSIRDTVKTLDDAKVFCTDEENQKSDNETRNEMAREVAQKICFKE